MKLFNGYVLITFYLFVYDTFYIYRLFSGKVLNFFIYLFELFILHIRLSFILFLFYARGDIIIIIILKVFNLI